MGKKIYSRRNFLGSFLNSDKTRSESETISNEDPLFKKYKRKEFRGRNNYRNVDTKQPYVENDGTDELPTANRIGIITSTLQPYVGLWTKAEVLHLLRRTTYGFKVDDVNTLLGMSVSNAVDSLFNVGTMPSPPVNWYQYILPDENNLPYGSDWTSDAINSLTIGEMTNLNRQRGLERWNLGLALNQQTNLREKMTWFWYHFIPVDFNAVRNSGNLYAESNSARICFQYVQMFRENALGNFRDIITNMCTQPAMMYYLNNQANTNTAPDENFAREIMELFTLGKDPASQYTQDDVVAAAKVLTGWRVQNLNVAPTTTSFVSNLHHTGTKQFSSFFNNTTIANNGANELTSFINMIFNKQLVVARYICRRLYRYFVYYDIDANIETNIIVPMANTFIANGWNITPVLKQLFKSEHFYDMANKGVYIKSPFDLVIGCLRTFNIQHNVNTPNNYQAQYQTWGYFNDAVLNTMDQSMGHVPDVAGWKAFYQNPTYHEYWINANTTQKRFTFLERLFNGYYLNYNGQNTHIKVDTITWIQQFSNAICADPDALIAECVSYLLPRPLSATKLAEIKTQTLLGGQTTNSYWTTAWNTYLNDVNNTANANIVATRLKAMFITITQYAEFQLM